MFGSGESLSCDSQTLIPLITVQPVESVGSSMQVIPIGKPVNNTLCRPHTALWRPFIFGNNFCRVVIDLDAAIALTFTCYRNPDLESYDIAVFNTLEEWGDINIGVRLPARCQLTLTGSFWGKILIRTRPCLSFLPRFTDPDLHVVIPLGVFKCCGNDGFRVTDLNPRELLVDFAVATPVVITNPSNP